MSINPRQTQAKRIRIRLRKEKEKLEKGIEELSKIDFACEADAREALFRFSKENKNSIYKIKGDVEVCFKKAKEK